MGPLIDYVGQHYPILGLLLLVVVGVFLLAWNMRGFVSKVEALDAQFTNFKTNEFSKFADLNTSEHNKLKGELDRFVEERTKRDRRVYNMFMNVAKQLARLEGIMLHKKVLRDNPQATDLLMGLDDKENDE